MDNIQGDEWLIKMPLLFVSISEYAFMCLYVKEQC